MGTPPWFSIISQREATCMASCNISLPAKPFKIGSALKANYLILREQTLFYKFFRSSTLAKWETKMKIKDFLPLTVCPSVLNRSPWSVLRFINIHSSYSSVAQETKSNFHQIIHFGIFNYRYQHKEDICYDIFFSGQFFYYPIWLNVYIPF